MKAFSAAYRNEAAKMLRRKKYIVFIIIGVLICIIWAGLGSFASGLIGAHGGFFINLTPTPMGVLPFFLQVMIPLLIFMGVTDLITAEGSDHTMKAMICRPVERWKLYASKLLAVLTYAAVYLICVFIVSTALNQTLGRPLEIGALFTTLGSYAITVPPLAVLVSFAALAALFGRSATLTMFILVAIYMAMSILPIIFPILAEILFTSYLGWYRLWVGALPSASRLIHMLTIVIGYGVVFYTAGSLLFDRKEY